MQIKKCVNHVSDYAILYEPETPEEIEKKQEHIDQASREKDI